MNENPDIHRHLRSLGVVILLGFLAVILASLYWSLIRAPAILAREDNPRLVEAALRVRRGAIWDRDGVLLAETAVLSDTDALTRRYPIPEIGPAVGYYSFRHGATGIEEGYNPLLRGEAETTWREWQRQTLHRPQIGRDVQLTLDADLQQAAEALLRNQDGALLLLNLDGNQIEAMVSHPGYDPNLLDENFEALVAAEDAPLLNRATLGQYQPGRILQPFLVAAALDAGLISLDTAVANPDRPVPIDGQVIRCETPPPDDAAWADVLAHHCPGPMLDLAAELGPAGLATAFAQFGLTTAPDLPIDTDTAAPDPISDPEMAAVGQENLTVTPLQVGLALAALATDGRLHPAQLVTAVTDEAGEWQPVDEEGEAGRTAVSAAVARALRRALSQTDNFLEYSALVLSGPEGETNAWYLGVAPAANPRYVLILVAENEKDLPSIQTAGRSLLETALESGNR